MRTARGTKRTCRRVAFPHRLDSSTLLCHPYGMDWKRLATYVIHRRVQLGYRTRAAFASALRISTFTVAGLERDHRAVSPDTLAAIENLLEWKPGSARAILEGGEPTPLGADAAPSQPAAAPSKYAHLSDTEVIRLFRARLAQMDELNRESSSLLDEWEKRKGQSIG